MAIICPNKNSKQYKDLVEQFGESLAESLSIRKGDIPSIEEAQMMVRGSKVTQFKKAVNYLHNTTSNSITDLMNNLFRIVQKIGNDYFVVKGSRIDQVPAPATEREIHVANRNFLQAVNEGFGNLFKVNQVSEDAQIDSIRDNIIQNIKEGEFDTLYALTYKRYAQQPEMHDTLINELLEQLRGSEADVNELEDAFGIDLTNQLRLYSQLTGEPLKENKTAATQEFFSDVVTGTSEKFKPLKSFEPILAFTAAQEKFKKVYDTFKGKFDEHIATSIPTFRELQIKVGSTLTEMFSKTGGLIYDIGGSEGGFVKSISKLSNGKIQTVNLDVNEDMRRVHEATPVKGSVFINEAFLEPYESYPRHIPIQKADVVHESMVFQFISPERYQFIREMKNNYLTEDGIALLEEKVNPPTIEEWKKNEEIKDTYKRQYYEQEALNQKAEIVLSGMKKNQTYESDLLNALNSNFKYVGQYWDSGNFKGYMATDSKEKFDDFRNRIGEVTSQYGARTPGNFIVYENRIQKSGPSLKVEFLTPAKGTYKVDVDQTVLNKIALDNIIRQEKETRDDPKTQKDAFNINKKVYNNEAPYYSRAYGEGVVGIVNHTLLNNLKRKFGIPFQIVNDNTVNWRGKFENGKVYINASQVTEYTPLHEYLHPFTMAMQKDNPVLYNNLIDELQNTESGKVVISEVEQNYPELNRKDQLDEALVTYMSRLVTSDQIKSKPWYQRLIDWFKQIFSKNGFSISNLNMNLTINDLIEKIIDPIYSADLKKYYDFNDTAVKYFKAGIQQTQRFEQLIEQIKTRLRLDISISPRTEEERSRKFFSGKQLALLEQNKDVFHAINDYVISAIINAKKMSDQFDEFKKFYEGKQGKFNRDEILKGMNLLSQIEQHIALYNESRFVIDAIRDENIDEYEDNFKVLANRLNKDVKLINDYHQYGLKLMADWLYPYTEKANQAAIKSGNKNKILGYDEYIQYKQENPNMTDKEALEHGVKKYLMGQMEHAKSDVGFFSSYMSGVINTNDSISQLIGISLKDEFSKNNMKLIKVRNGIANAVKGTIGTKIFTTNKQHKEFYSKFLREVNSWEKVGYDENDNPQFGIVKRTGFVEEYNYDDFYNAKRKMFREIGIRPNKSDTVVYAAWNAKKEDWFNKNTIKTVDAQGNIKIIPTDQYRNTEYDQVKNDPLYKELYKHYQDGNAKLGQYQLKYGIIPQVSLGAGLFSDLKISKGIKGNLKAVKNVLKENLAASVNQYYAQDIDGKEYKNVPIRYTRMVDEEDLNYNLAQTVGDFWEASAKYQTARTVEPMIMTLRNFIEGNSFLRIDERTVPEVDAKGLKKLGNFVKNVTKNKDQSNINRMLIDFVNDVIYGEVEKKSNIKSPFLNLKFLVYKDGDTSINGKPYKQFVYSIEDLKKQTGNENLTIDNFVKGTEKDVNGYKVTLLRNDKILSVNKLSKGVNTATSTIALGGNVLAGVSNILSGVAVNFVEATGGKYYNLKDFTAAYKDYFKALSDFSFIEDTRGGKGSKLTQLFAHYGIFKGEFANEYGKHIGSGVVNKLFRRSSLFMLLHAGEHFIQGTHMLATMRHQKVRDNTTGKDISLFEAYEVGPDGYIKIKDGVTWNENQDTQFRDTLQSLHKDKGNYSDFDKAALSRLWWGKMVLMFRRHIFNGIKARWGKEYIDYERGNAVQGYYRSFMTTLASEINELRLNGRFRKLTEEEAYNFKKTSAEIGMMLLLALVLVPAFKDEEPHETGMNDYIALFSRRLQQDVSFFFNPLEWKKVIQSPVVTGNTIDKFYDFVSQVTIAPSEEYQRDGFGYVSGDNKAMVKLKKLIPVYGKLMNLQNPQEILKFYDLTLPVKTGQ